MKWNQIWRFAPIAAAVMACTATVHMAYAQSPAGAIKAASPVDGGAVVVSGPAGQVTAAELEAIVREFVPPQRRDDFWKSPDASSDMARSIYNQRALAQQALAEKLDATPEGAIYLTLLRERALTELLMQHRVKSRSPDEAAQISYARSEYRAHPDKYKLPEQVKARHILLKVAPDGSDDAAVKARAESIRSELLKGADFLQLAREHSSDAASAERGGDLGFFARGRMVPEFEQAVFSLKKAGDLSKPIKTQFGYHIIELTDRKPAGNVPFEEASPALREEVLNKFNAEERRRTWEQVQGQAQVNADALREMAARHQQKAKR